ncbi:MAG: YkgJ family cysteine cluster protein [Rhodocyclaceae bacterium]|nr:YkgJ family cysteine cluster protein [Rhodocyclaceae bacterium]MBX3668470.1 YkgJ family cysteine cluster protein [Rhodocyclaceae bacterium]
MDVDFQCVRCGNCCRNLRLPLSVAEAMDWLQAGHSVQVLCEAIPWPGEPPASNVFAAYKRERSFPALSGDLPIRVIVTLVAPLGSGCPNLGPDNACGIYAHRPGACRIYPAESNPFVQIVPARRLCPPDAWRAGSAPFLRDSDYADDELRLVIRTRLGQMVADVSAHASLCAALGIRAAAMANEGFIAHAPDQTALLAALRDFPPARPAPAQDWEFVSDRIETVQAIRSCDAHCQLAGSEQLPQFEYLSLNSMPA